MVDIIGSQVKMLVSVIYCKCNYNCCCSTAGVSLPIGAVCAEKIREKKKKREVPQSEAAV